MRTVAVLFLVVALGGCGGGGWVPHGPHAMDSASLERLVQSESLRNGLQPSLVRAVIDVESRGDPSAVSRVGAAGLMQLMPQTAATYGVVNPFDPYENVSGGCRYLHDLLGRYHDVRKALAAYNAGPAVVDAYRGIPPFAETRDYVARVTAEART